MARRKAHYVNYQQRAKEFAVGDEVFPFLFGDEYGTGRVVAVYDAIGFVDVEYPNGTKSHPVEELQRVRTEVQPPAITENVPGGPESVSVPGGPPLKGTPLKEASQPGHLDRIARAFVKKSLYWASRDRKYRASQQELEASDYACPKCRNAQLRRAVYKRSNGQSDRLLGCPSCLFLIKSCDILGHPDYAEAL